MQKRILGVVLLIQLGCSSKDPFSTYQLAARPEQANQGQTKAVLVMHAGEVSIQSANGHRFSAQPALPLLSNDQIATKNNSFAIVHLHNNHVVRLDEDLRLQVANLAMFHAKKTSLAVAQQLTSLLKPEERNQPERIVGWHARMQAAQTATSLREPDKLPAQPQPESKPQEALVAKRDQRAQTQPKVLKKERSDRSKTKMQQPIHKRTLPKELEKAPKSPERVKRNVVKPTKKTQKISRKFTRPATRNNEQQAGARALAPKGAPSKKLRRPTPKKQNPTITRWRIGSHKDWRQPNTLPDQIKRLFQQETVLNCLRTAPPKSNKLQLSLKITNNLIKQIRTLGGTMPRCLQTILQKHKLSGMTDTTIMIEVNFP